MRARRREKSRFHESLTRNPVLDKVISSMCVQGKAGAYISIMVEFLGGFLPFLKITLSKNLR